VAHSGRVLDYFTECRQLLHHITMTLNSDLEEWLISSSAASSTATKQLIEPCHPT
jgi:hypothetical protein